MEKRKIQRIGIDVDRRRFIATGPAFVVASAAMLTACARGSSSHAGRRERLPIDAQPIEFDRELAFQKLNSVRRKRLLPVFAMDERLQKAADDYAQLMGSRGLYGHEIGPGTDFKSRIFSVGWQNSAGENIGVGYRSIDDAIEGWMDSPPHRKNMLKARYNRAGFGYGFNTSGRNPRYTHFWVLILGKG